MVSVKCSMTKSQSAEFHFSMWIHGEMMMQDDRPLNELRVSPAEVVAAAAQAPEKAAV